MYGVTQCITRDGLCAWEGLAFHCRIRLDKPSWEVFFEMGSVGGVSSREVMDGLLLVIRGVIRIIIM